MPNTVSMHHYEGRVTRDKLDKDLLSGETLISRIMLRLADLNFQVKNIPYWMITLVRFEKTEDSFFCKMKHVTKSPVTDSEGILRPANFYEMCLLTRTAPALLYYGDKSTIDELPADPDFVPVSKEVVDYFVDKLIQNEVRNRFRRYRREQEITVKDMADTLGVSYGTLENFEKHACKQIRFFTMPNLIKLSKLFGIDMNTLALGSDFDAAVLETMNFHGNVYEKYAEEHQPETRFCDPLSRNTVIGLNGSVKLYSPAMPISKVPGMNLPYNEMLSIREFVQTNIDNITVDTLMSIWTLMKLDQAERQHG